MIETTWEDKRIQEFNLVTAESKASRSIETVMTKRHNDQTGIIQVACEVYCDGKCYHMQ